jgi:ectoine hydroxylase-related dioxygenase (phytanoyl-CoA dioxygenase family)
MPMKAGDAIFYHHGLLHFSPPNRTSWIRPAINLTLVPKEAECIHYCMPEGAKQIEMYSVEKPGFLLILQPFSAP